MIEVREVAPRNALLPMLVTLTGMVMEVREVAPRNALLPMLVSWLPWAKVIEVSLVAEVDCEGKVMLVTLAGMVTSPTQLEREVTASFEIVTDPEVEQLIFPV